MAEPVDFRISGLRFIPARPASGLLAFASFVIDNRWYIGNIAIYVRQDGLGFRLSWPRKRLSNGSEIIIFRPHNPVSEEELTALIVSQFQELLSSDQTNA